MKIKVEMIQEDIMPGNQCNACECPIAKAITRTTGKEALVGTQAAFVYEDAPNGDGKTVRVFPLPPVAAEFRKSYDLFEWVEPISFELEEKVPA